MNSDDFEKRLQRQPLRPIPGEWRAEVLRRAEAAAPRPAAAGSSPFAMFLRRLVSSLSPHPAAWAALAAVWVLIFALNTASHSHAPQLAKNIARPTVEMVAGLKEQQKILAELIGPSELPAIERPKRFPAQPHSERREETSMV